tara:strand:- start:136 stop:636 length:501 start_codon:yes stop_codon:yes gene_type:complete
MTIKKTDLEGVLKIIPPTIFRDFRGEYIETYNKDFFQKNNINIDFIQDDISVSKKNVLRGIHGDDKTWKLITCLYGSFFLVVVNNDKNSSQYKKSTSIILTDKNRELILIPPKFGNGHVVLSEIAIFHYKQNTNYDRSPQFTIKWNDSNYNFGWPIKNPILSERDK